MNKAILNEERVEAPLNMVRTAEMPHRWNGIRSFFVTRCPKCRSGNTRDVPGWNKQECKRCGYTWQY